MKVKMLFNVKHNGRLYEKGHIYDLSGDLEDVAKELLEIVHENVHTQKSTVEREEKETVKAAEEAPASAEAESQPAPMPKTPPLGGTPAPTV